MKVRVKDLLQSSLPFLVTFLAVVFCSLAACQSDKRELSVQNEKSDKDQNLATSVAIGKLAPDFEFQTITQQKIGLRDLKGKLILLNLWATWCVPCVAEMPSLERLQKAFKNKPFEVVAINVDPADNLDSVKKFVKENGLSFKILHDPELSLPPRYGVSGFPESFFIDPNGNILGFKDPESGKLETRVIGDRPWDSKEYISAVGELIESSLKTDTASKS